MIDYGKRTGKLATALETLWDEMSGAASRRRAEARLSIKRLEDARPRRGLVRMEMFDLRKRADVKCIDCPAIVKDWLSGYPAICPGCLEDRTR